MFYILGWVIYGLIVGGLAKLIHPGDEPVGCLYTIGIGVVGSLIGGVVNFIIGGGGGFSPSGIIMGVLGGVLFLFGLQWYTKNTDKNV